MKNEIIVTLPKKQEMLERLCAVSDNEHLKERFYPILLESAGERRVAPGVVMMIICAMREYTRDMPGKNADVAVMELCQRFPKFIDALVKNEHVAQHAKDIFAVSYAEACAAKGRGGVGDAQDATGNGPEKT